MTVELHSFEDAEVVGTTIKITRAGDGLSQALAIEPREYRVGERVIVILETVVKSVTMDTVKDSTQLTRVHTLVTQVATTGDTKAILRLLDQQRKANDRAKGKPQLEFEDEGETEAEAVGDGE